ncbi:MAG: U32 family peptidase [Clostridia bacterium]|nr:U32 family peptidase [Clostridia bacterium]
MNKPELLAPAGSLEKAKAAFLYGADAIYCGTGSLSLRSRADVDDDELAKVIEYAHSIGKKVYTTINIYAPDTVYEDIIKQVKMLNKLAVDAIIVSDGGIIDIINDIAPDIPIHISTQANTLSAHSANFWYKNGAKRVILSREMNKSEIKYLIDNTPQGLETEIFIHGAICWAYSGRCYLSDFMASRNANLGDCAQSCRWEYNMYIEEKNNPGNIMPIDEDKNGTYVLSSKDLCLIKRIPEIVEMGVTSLKIEGRLKSAYYLASVVNAYRNAIDDYIDNPENYDYKKYMNELEKVKTRELTEFFFNDKNNKDFQEFEGKQYNPNYEFGGIVEEYNENKSTVKIGNRLQVGDKMEIVIPNKIKVEKFTINKLWDSETDEELEYINPGRLGQTVKMHLPIKSENGWVIRRKK